MSKLKSKSDVVEWYWPDFLDYCAKDSVRGYKVKPTVDNFWDWYINAGPMGLKQRNLYYTKKEVEYV